MIHLYVLIQLQMLGIFDPHSSRVRVNCMHVDITDDTAHIDNIFIYFC